jgi:hypothetical protein
MRQRAHTSPYTRKSHGKGLEFRVGPGHCSGPEDECEGALDLKLAREDLLLRQRLCALSQHLRHIDAERCGEVVLVLLLLHDD